MRVVVYNEDDIVRASFIVPQKSVTEIQTLLQTAVPPKSFTVDYKFSREEIQYLVQGKTIQVIKNVKEQTNCSLIEAKRTVDEAKEAMGLVELTRERCSSCHGFGYVVTSRNLR